MMVVVVLTAGCAGLEATTGGGWPDRGTASIHGEVRSVDTRRQRITVRPDRGRNTTVAVDGRTTVVYRQRRYPVSALERGDLVSVRAVRDRRGNLVADRIEVRRSVREIGRSTARVQRLDGTVAWSDARSGAFGVAVSRNRNVAIYLPRNAGPSDRARLVRLRRGDRVRADVRAVGRDQFELVRFR
jgi:hypothetical protein